MKESRESIEYHENGEIKVQGFLDGESRKQGQWLTYFENGRLYIEENYLNDESHGIFKRWYENGNLAVEAMYKSGKGYGQMKEYYENSSLKEEGDYVDSDYFVKNFWDENGNQTLINGTGFKIEKYGTDELDIYKQFFEDYKFIREEKISSMYFIKGSFRPESE